MKAKKIRGIVVLSMMLCLVSAVVFLPDKAKAKKITSISQAEKKALRKVKGGTVTEVDKDYEAGVIVYEIQILKGTKEYDVTYRASDGKLLSYGWEEHRVNRTTKKKIMSRAACRKLAKKKVKGAKITTLVRKFDDGVDVYKLKLKAKNKRYTLEYHARIGKLLEYEWEIAVKSSAKSSSSYIGVSKARKIALEKVPGADVVKVEFDRDDGIPQYEVELIKDIYEYQVTIHARTGAILEYEKELLD